MMKTEEGPNNFNKSLKTALVTGGAGFIGSELVQQLASRGYQVTVVDNFVNGKRENLAGVPKKSLKIIKGDIRDEKLIRNLMDGTDMVFHLACLGVRHSIHSPVENHEVNAFGALNLLLAAKEAEVKRFVHISTSEVYGTAMTVPMVEDHPTYPMTVYGAAKLAGEAYARAFYRTYGFPTVIVRPFNTYGPRCHHEGDSGEVIPKFMLRCLADQPLVIFGDGTQTRDFLYVSDTARGIILAGESADTIGNTINLGSGSEITINKLAKAISGVTKKPDARMQHETQRPGDTLRLYADISRARKILDFKPKVTLKEGLSNLMAWYTSQGSSAEDLLEQEVTHTWIKHEP
ncbi:MAG: SDR family NAD(P)-dependent oxidoreductase [Methanoregula sp.]